MDQDMIITIMGSILMLSEFLPFVTVGGSGIIDTLYLIFKSGIDSLKEKRDRWEMWTVIRKYKGVIQEYTR